MNADKLADALREYAKKLTADATKAEDAGMPNKAQILTDIAYELECLAAHDAQPAQAAQPVLYAISTSMRSWWTYDKDEADAARFDGANVQEIREQAARPAGVPDDLRNRVYQRVQWLLAGQEIDVVEFARDVGELLCPQPPAQPGADAEDAARYRFLADSEDGDLFMENPGKEALDAAIDAARAARPLE